MLSIVNYKEKHTEWFDNQSLKNLYYSKNWLDILHSSYGFTINLLIDENDKLLFIFCPISDAMGNRIISLPFSDYVPKSELSTHHITDFFELLTKKYPEYKVLLKTIYSPENSIKINIVKKAVYHLVDLSTDLQQKQSTNFRRGVKKAQKSGVISSANLSKSALHDFYNLFHQLRFEKFKIIPQPFSFFEKIWQNFIENGQGFIFEAKKEDKVIASTIILCFDNVAYYKYGCSAIDYLQYKPNNMLFHELMSFLKSRGIKFLDLGLSGCSDNYAGLRRWKKAMGGEEKPVVHYERLPAYTDEQEEKINNFKKSIHSITNSIVSENTDVHTTSQLSEILYPLFA